MRLLKAMRVNMRIPKLQLAHEAGISLREVTRAEADDYVPNRETLRKLDRAFARIQAQRMSDSHLGDPLPAPAPPQTEAA